MPDNFLSYRSRLIREMWDICPLYFILDESLCRSRSPLDVAEDAMLAGVKTMQLRFKNLPSEELTSLATILQQKCSQFGCLLIVNDSVHTSLSAGAAGVHLGADDLEIAKARQIAPELIIGATARTPEAAMLAAANGADYIGSGSVFASPTKQGLEAIGTNGLARVCKSTDLPVTGIGGINADNCHDVVSAGATAFCSIAPFAHADDVQQSCLDLVLAWNNGTNSRGNLQA